MTDYFKQKMQLKNASKAVPQSDCEQAEKEKKRKLSDEASDSGSVDKAEKKKKKKQKLETNEELDTELVKQSSKKKTKNRVAHEPADSDITIEDQPVKTKKKSREQLEAQPAIVAEEKTNKKSKRKSEVPPSVVQPEPAQTEEERPRGLNVVYSTNVIQIPSHVAQKMTSMSIHNFKNANIANVVGYGLPEEIEIKTVQTKVGDNFSTDKYSLYNVDKLTTRQHVNPRKMFKHLKKTKKSIQVI